MWACGHPNDYFTHQISIPASSRSWEVMIPGLRKDASDNSPDLLDHLENNSTAQIFVLWGAFIAKTPI